jgi:hypothetical protein
MAEQKDKTRTKKEFHYLLSRQMNFDKRKTDKQTYRQIDKKTDRQKYKQTNSRITDRQTNRQKAR